MYRRTIPIAAGKTAQVDAWLSEARNGPQARVAAVAPPPASDQTNRLAESLPEAEGLAGKPARSREGGASEVAEDGAAKGVRQTGPDRAARVRGFWLATAGGALASLGFGVVKHLQAADRARTFSNHRGPSGGSAAICGEEELDRGGPDCKRLYGEAKRAQRWAFVGYGLAAALTAGSLLLYLTGRDSGDEPRATAMACVPLTAQRGLACTMRF